MRLVVPSAALLLVSAVAHRQARLPHRQRRPHRPPPAARAQAVYWELSAE